MNDYTETRRCLSISADSIQNPEKLSILGQRSLKRINFLRHNYFLLFLIHDDDVIITNIFHGTEDFENKLR